ncbi:MAG: TIR domain-containing protein [Coriobacteriales bacterium]|nr:TIR domain-containing protein [Coriobacteriales bacterium]
MAGGKPAVYEGDRDYVFACYAHADELVVLPIIRALASEGYRVWYDDGIELASQYPMRIADHVYGCAFFILFVSRASLRSGWCSTEVNYALDLGKTVLPVFLEDVELTRDLQMRLGRTQSLFWHELSEHSFYVRLFGTARMDSCLTPTGKRKRGVRPRKDSRQTAETRVRVEATRIVSLAGVTPRDLLSEYSWAELKEISRAIAAAGSDAEWKAIAREYGLVDKGGRLRGAEKGLKLTDGTPASVRILGFRHDVLAAGGKAGISFEFADVPKKHRMNAHYTYAGGWERSEMRAWLNSEFLEMLPTDLRVNVAVARKRTNNVGEVTKENDPSVVSVTNDGIWLLSMGEVFGELSGQKKCVLWSPATYDAEGTQYQLYKDERVTTTTCEPCKKRGADSRWWLRSPYALGMDRFHLVYDDGSWDYGDALRAGGVSPGFCF